MAFTERETASISDALASIFDAGTLAGFLQVNGAKHDDDALSIGDVAQAGYLADLHYAFDGNEALTAAQNVAKALRTIRAIALTDLWRTIGVRWSDARPSVNGKQDTLCDGMKIGSKGTQYHVGNYLAGKGCESVLAFYPITIDSKTGAVSIGTRPIGERESRGMSRSMLARLAVLHDPRTNAAEDKGKGKVDVAAVAADAETHAASAEALTTA